MIKPILVSSLLYLIIYMVDSKCPKLVTPFAQVNCTDKATETESYYYYFNETTCIPTCKLYVPQAFAPCDANNRCIPGYSCEKRCSGMNFQQYTCETNADCASKPEGNSRLRCMPYCLPQYEGSCMAYHSVDDYKDTFWTALKFKPTCDNDGNYLAKQCKGGLSGRCLCYSAIGKRIFGQSLRKESDDMTCACSRKKSDLESSGKLYVSFHCDSKGNYEKLQCDMLSEQCWCAEPKTGLLTSTVVPMKAMDKLSCYISTLVGNQYLRQCESQKYAQLIINQKLKIHGVKWVPTSPLICDDDGSYGAYYMSAGIAYCTWRDGSKIGTWQANSEAQYSGVDCNCARDWKMYSFTQSCEGSGNYKVLQQVIVEGKDYYYCVDSDGFAKSDLFEDKNTNCSTFY